MSTLSIKQCPTRGFNCLRVYPDYTQGAIFTPQGIVWVYHDSFKTLIFELVHQNKVFTKQIKAKKRHAKPGLKRMALSYARFIAKEFP